jgi:hypothetical protein
VTTLCDSAVKKKRRLKMADSSQNGIFPYQIFEIEFQKQMRGCLKAIGF